MSKINITIKPEVLEILRASKIEGNNLKLPDIQLARPLYEEVNKVIVNAGGKWNRGGKCHIFTSDPKIKLGLAIETGVSVNEKNKFQSFYTPPELARKVVALADVKKQIILEPSAGDGALAFECVAQGCSTINCVELNPDACAILKKEGMQLVFNEDFLDFASRCKVKFTRIVMNPPFTKNQDIKHVKAALGLLNEGGILVSIMSPNTKRKGFDEIINSGQSEIIEVEEGAFKESGTNIRTIIVKIQK